MSTWLSKFKICLQSDGLNALRPLSELIIAEPNRAPFLEYTRIVGKNGAGHNITDGFPTCRWEWNELPQTDIDVLQGYSAQDVYIQTEVNTGVPRQFRIYACYAQPLIYGDINRRVAYDGANDGLRQRRPVAMEFFGLVDQTIQVSSFN